MYQYMNSLLLTLSLLSVLSAVASANPEGGFAFSQGTYDELNSYLESNHLSDPMEGIFKLEKLMHEEQEKGKNPLVFNGAKVKGLKQIVMLANIADPKKPYCNAAALKVIEQNEYAIRAVDKKSIFVLKMNDALGDLKPIQRMVLHFTREHAQSCTNVYPELMKTKLTSLDQSNVNLVEKLLSGVLDSQLKEEKERNPKQTDSQAIYGALIERRQALTIDDAQIILSALKEVSKDDSAQYTSNGELFNDLKKNHKDGGNAVLLEKYLLKPCRYYNEQLESIVKPAWHDFKFGMRLSDDKMEFYRSLALYGICNTVLYP